MEKCINSVHSIDRPADDLVTAFIIIMLHIVIGILVWNSYRSFSGDEIIKGSVELGSAAFIATWLHAPLFAK